MSQRIAIVAALPSELKPLVRGWKRLPAPRYVSLWTSVDADGDELVAVCAGMGAVAAGRAFAAAEARGKIDAVLSVGLAGATDRSLALGEVSAVSEVVDVQTGERFTLAEGGRGLRLATVTHTANAREKARLLATYGAVLVDMEAATISRLSAMRGVPMGCFKAVSDGADEHLPEIDRFVDAQGQLSVPRFLAHIAVRPQTWSPVAHLARSSARASTALAVYLQQFLSHKDLAFTNRTGTFTQGAAKVGTG